MSTALTRAVGLPPVPANWTLANFESVLTVRNAEALGRSLVLAAPGRLAAARARWLRGRPGAHAGSVAATGTLVTLTFVLPGSTLAVGLLITYGRWLGGTLLLILLAYLAKLWAFAHRPISGRPGPAAAGRAVRRPGRAAPRCSVAVRTVVLRPLAPALLAAWLVCFLTALHEVTMSMPALRAGQRDARRRRAQQCRARPGRTDGSPVGGAHPAAARARRPVLVGIRRLELTRAPTGVRGRRVG